MAKVIPFRNDDHSSGTIRRLGSRKVRKRSKPDPEDLGQLNLFDQTPQITLTHEANYFEEALVLDEQSDPRAEQYYRKAIERNQSTADAYCNLGILADQKKDPSLAIHHFSLALKTNPRHLEAHYNLANVYAEQGNMTLCRMHYEVALQINPDFPPPYYNLALVLIALKEYDAARQSLERYIELSPDHSLEDDQSIIQLLNQIKAVSS
jgi:tetratricopeptide (TPR) repeat protein